MDKIIFYHNPMSRGQIVHWMLEEAGAKYETNLLDFNKQEHKTREYLSINPMGKIPTIIHGKAVVTECAAICTYLAEIFPEKRLAPSVGSPLRGGYFRWLFFASGCLEPALSDKAFPRVATAKASAIGYGTYDDTLSTVQKAISNSPYLLGDQFTAADLYLASQMGYGLRFGTMEDRPGFSQYLQRCQDRPSYQRQQEQSAKFMEQLKK